LKTPPGIY